MIIQAGSEVVNVFAILLLSILGKASDPSF